jgi:hypothetical protein
MRNRVRNLNWSIRLERLESRLPLDGGLGDIVYDQLQMIYFDFWQMQTGPQPDLDFSTVQPGSKGGRTGTANPDQSQFFYQAQENEADGLNADRLHRDAQFSNGTSVVQSQLTPESYRNDNLPIPDPIIISLPEPQELIAISLPELKERVMLGAEAQIAGLPKLRITKLQNAIERNEVGQNDESIEHVAVSKQGIVETFANNAIAPIRTLGQRVAILADSSIEKSVESVRSVGSESLVPSSEVIATRISNDMYYEKTEAANDRHELGWTTDGLASATRQQVISEFSALVAIIASRESTDATFGNPLVENRGSNQVELTAPVVSNVPHLESPSECLEISRDSVNDRARSQSMGIAEIKASPVANAEDSLRHSSWGHCIILALAGVTLSLISSEKSDRSSVPELLASRTGRGYPFGRGLE